MAQQRWLVLAAHFSAWCAVGAWASSPSSSSSSSSSSSLVITEQHGNSSFECIASQRCVPCALAQKQNDDVYHCAATGYYMPYKCVGVAVTASGGRQGEEEAPQQPDKAAAAKQDKEANIFHIYKSCVPPIPEDKLSVVGFEGIMLGVLAVFSPVLYLRKKRGFGFVPAGMTRIPSSTRF